MLARWLRHRPDVIGIKLVKNGWNNVAELIAKAAAAGMLLTHEELVQIVAEGGKYHNRGICINITIGYYCIAASQHGKA